ncbi:MAG: hypothetical protein RR797_01705, partial [Christensenella sp.]
MPNSVMTHDTPDSYIPTQNFENMIESVVKYNKVSEEQTFIEDVRKLTDYRIIGQVWSTYVVVECADCLYLIDQHAAHER